MPAYWQKSFFWRLELKLECQYCKQKLEDASLPSHEQGCPLAPTNLANLAKFLVRRTSKLTRAEEHFSIPSVSETNVFCSVNGIHSYQSLRRIYGQVDWETIVVSIIRAALERGVVDREALDPFVLRRFDPYMFFGSKEYERRKSLVEKEENRHFGYVDY